MDDPESTPNKFEDVNWNLVEELCGASYDEITPFELENQNPNEYQYSIISPNQRDIEIDEIIRNSIEKSKESAKMVLDS